MIYTKFSIWYSKNKLAGSKRSKTNISFRCFNSKDIRKLKKNHFSWWYFELFVHGIYLIAYALKAHSIQPPSQWECHSKNKGELKRRRGWGAKKRWSNYSILVVISAVMNTPSCQWYIPRLTEWLSKQWRNKQHLL